MMKIVTSDKLLLSLSEFENERYYSVQNYDKVQ